MLSQAVIAALESAGSVYEVGGVVRDQLLGIADEDVKDRDYLVTGIPFERLIELLKRHGRIDLVGKSFGVIKFTQSLGGVSSTCDITLPRSERSTGSGHSEFDVTADHLLPVSADLQRRDFTVNAIARRVATGELIDPFGGVSDLQHRILRMTSPQSFPEDPLRMMRGVQFAARFHLTPEPATLAAMQQYAALIKTVSPERIAEELNKLLTRAAEPSHGFRLMQQTGLLSVVLPELEACVGVTQPGPYHRWDVFEHSIRAIDAARLSLTVRLAALLHDINKPQHRRIVDERVTFYGHEISGARTAKRVLQRLRYPNELISVVSLLVERHMFSTGVTDKGLRRLIRRVGVDHIFDLLELRKADTIAQGMGQTTDEVEQFAREVRAELDRRPPFGLADLAVNGTELMQELGLGPGPIVGTLLNYLLDVVVDLPEENSRERLLSLARAKLTGDEQAGRDTRKDLDE